MMISQIDLTFDWLKIKLPHIQAFSSGNLLGSFGLISLSILVASLAPASLILWMPGVLIFSSANSAYKFMEKRDQQNDAKLLPYLLISSIWLFALASGVQAFVEFKLFNSQPHFISLPILLLSSCAGTWIGQRLRRAYEKLYQ